MHDTMTSSSHHHHHHCNHDAQMSEVMWEDRAVRATGFGYSGTISIIFIRFWSPCERINADNGHRPWGKPIPSYDGSPARPDLSVAGLTSSPWCHPSQEMAELFRRSSYSPVLREGACIRDQRAGAATCNGSMRNTSSDQVALAPSSGNQFRTR